MLPDLQLPDASGLDGLRQLLRHGELAVVVLTGLDDQHQGVAAVGAGAQDYLAKGQIDGRSLVRVIRYAVQRHRAEVVARQLSEAQLDALRGRLERQRTGLAAAHAHARDSLDSAATTLLVVCIAIGAGLLVLLVAIGIWAPHHRHTVERLGREVRTVAAVDGARRMSVLINDLLAFSRVGRSAADEWGSVQCEVLLAQALRNLDEVVTQTGARITHDPLPAVYGEASLLTTVFQNLVGNAMNFRGEQPPQIHRRSTISSSPSFGSRATETPQGHGTLAGAYRSAPWRLDFATTTIYSSYSDVVHVQVGPSAGIHRRDAGEGEGYALSVLPALRLARHRLARGGGWPGDPPPPVVPGVRSAVHDGGGAGAGRGEALGCH